MIDLHKALSKLCEAASGKLAATDYATMLDIKSTANKCDKVALVAELNQIITKIKKLCTSDEVAMFEFYFQKLDQDEQPSCLLKLGKLVYPENIYVGTLIAKKWRGDKFRADELIAKASKCSGGEARKIVGRNKSVLTALLHQFINTDYLLADEIEEVLQVNEIIRF
ncbi:MAG: hypothetical protein K2Y14_04025 [Burkholderiales bacterium]|nr:hypothetical protein [Burkholderiales bacterium]